jgi:hypothetical protein
MLILKGISLFDEYLMDIYITYMITHLIHIETITHEVIWQKVICMGL